jgi:hypothetical protein
MGSLIQLRDSSGNPTGTPLQNSHNWASLPGCVQNTPDLYPWLDVDSNEYAPWVHAQTVLHLPPHSRWKGRVDASFARWGGLPQANHYTLNLYGWGFYTGWEVSILGDWGESNCPAIDSFGDADVHDMRPLYVQSMNPQSSPKWCWTPNVGGLRYLDYFNAQDHKAWLINRPAFIAPGPCLTRAKYSGVTDDRCVAYEIEYMLPRGADINRTLHRIRYRVLRDTVFTKLAFFELGTPHYDGNSPKKLAYGNAAGLLREEQDFQRGTQKYFQKSVPLSGAAPWWVSLHESEVFENKGSDGESGNASRGLIVREWKAVLSGKDVPVPYVSFFGIKAILPSMNAEISAPPGITALKEGDFVEMTLEVVILPKHGEKYYGPDEPLRKSLETKADRWEGVYRQARGNDIRVDVVHGELISRFPLEVRVGGNQTAQLTVHGGLAHLPLSFSGLSSNKDYALYESTGESLNRVDQSVHGNDFWQTEYDEARDTYRMTFNVPIGTGDDHEGTKTFIFRRERK